MAEVEIGRLRVETDSARARDERRKAFERQTTQRLVSELQAQGDLVRGAEMVDAALLENEDRAEALARRRFAGHYDDRMAAAAAEQARLAKLR